MAKIWTSRQRRALGRVDKLRLSHIRPARPPRNQRRSVLIGGDNAGTADGTFMGVNVCAGCSYAVGAEPSGLASAADLQRAIECLQRAILVFEGSPSRLADATDSPEDSPTQFD